MQTFHEIVGRESRFSKSFDQYQKTVLTPGPLDERTVHAAALGMALALRHPDLGNFVTRSRQHQITAEEIAHLAAIASAVVASMTGVPGTSINPLSEAPQQRPGACC